LRLPRRAVPGLIRQPFGRGSRHASDVTDRGLRLRCRGRPPKRPAAEASGESEQGADGARVFGEPTMTTPLNSPDMRMTRSAWWSAFSHDGRRLYTCGDDPHIWAWDLKTFRLAGRIRTTLDTLLGPDLHSSLDQVAVGGTDGTVRV